MARIIWSFLLLSIVSGLAQAGAANIKSANKPVWTDPGWRQTVARYAVTFDEQGPSTTVYDFEFTALDRKGVEGISQEVFGYNGYFEELTVSDLQTVKTDGRVIAVDERAIRDEASSTDISSPYFDEWRKRVVAFSDVAVGDRVRGRLVYRDKRPRFPGQFARFWYLAPNEPPQVMELTIDGPASKLMRTSGRNVEHSEERVGDRIVHHVRFDHQTPQPKSAEISPFDSAPRFEASTFADYAALAAPLKARNAPMAAPSAALRKLAADIVGDAATTSATAERLYNWVAENIRYVGIGFEDGGLTSQPADAVVAARYGDCKAHAILLKALLAAEGVEANLVVVNGTPRYTLTELPTQNFDHAILYLPGLDIYVDPTAAEFAFGALPTQLSGKPVLNIDTGSLGRIPVARPEQRHLDYDIDYVLKADGSREGRAVLSGRGAGAALGRYFVKRLDGKDRKRAAGEFIENSNQEGTGDFMFADPHVLSDQYAVTMSFQLQKFDVDRWSLRLLALPDPRAQLWAISAGFSRDQPFQCRSLDYEQTVSVTLPDRFNAASKPAPVSYKTDIVGVTTYGEVGGHIEVTGEAIIDGRAVRSKVRLQLMFDAPVCPAWFAGEISKAMTKFDEMQGGVVGLTTKPTPYVNELSAEYSVGVKAVDRRNYGLALVSLKPLADKGHPKAEAYMGFMYENGLGVPIDLREAARWYGLAGEQGDTFSQTRLGYLHEKGLGVPRDDALAAQWYAKSAAAGDKMGQSWLGTLYRDGRGVGRNYKEAEKWFSLAAEQGSAWALMEIGMLHTQGGDGVPQDYVKAIEYFRKAADGGNVDALYNLGWAHERGLGVPQDRQQAIEWYSKAAGRGQALALKRLDALSERPGFWSALLRVVGL
jgi:TPR repeat protein/transglutaminase-like putative cysteine protease